MMESPDFTKQEIARGKFDQYPYSGKGELLGSAIRELPNGMTELDLDFELEVNVADKPESRSVMSDRAWVEHAYPLQQVKIRLQGTRHSDKDAIIRQLETVIARLKAGDSSGQDHDDDFGYTFDYVAASSGPSFFDECPCNFS